MDFEQLIDDKYRFPIARVKEIEDEGMFCCCPGCGREMELEFLLEYKPTPIEKFKEWAHALLLIFFLMLILGGSLLAIYDHFYEY